MGSSYLTNPLVFLVQVLFGAYILVVMLRFLLQLVRADFYNPVSQFVVKVTTPVLTPLRRVIPGVGGLDLHIPRPEIVRLLGQDHEERPVDRLRRDP